MANEETKPLLIKVNPNWKRRSNFTSAAIPSTDAGGTRSDVQRNSGDEVIKITSVLNGDSAKSWKVKVVLATILVSVVLERMVFYGLVGNLVIFLNLHPFKWKVYHAVCAVFLFFGISYIMSLIGGWISDSCLGRFKTIILSYGIYMCGYILLPFLAINTDSQNSNAVLPNICENIIGSGPTMFEEHCSWLIVVILIIIAIAAGILKANICPFGSDQLVRADQQTQLSFFNWFYWCVNAGSFLGLSVIIYIEQREKFLYGFLACAVALGCSAIIFVAGCPFYVSRPPDGSVLTNIFRIVREAWRNKREQRKFQRNINSSVSERSHAEIDEVQLAERKIPFLDYAKRRYGGNFHNSLVDDVKKLGMILAVFAVLIPYWLVYFQMQTTFMFQGLNMKLSFAHSSANTTAGNDTSSDTPQIAVGWFSLCDAIFVIILLPLFDRIIYPRMARAGYHFTFAKRIVLGMLFAAAAMVAAGVVEHFRWEALNPDTNRTCFHNYIPQKIGNTTYYASEMSVLWQVPQYALIGISEVFASVACLQFAVMVAPNSMKAAVTGLYYFFCGIGSFLGIALVSILSNLNLWFPNKKYSNINCWYPCDIKINGSVEKGTGNECHFDYYFFFLAGCAVLSLILFLIVARVYQLNIDELTFHVRQKNKVEGKVTKHVQRNASTTVSSS